MFKKLLLLIVTFAASMGFAFAEVDVNKADQAALDGIKGIGPAKSKMIIEERSKGGNFKDWTDFATRVKGIGEKSAVKLSEAGLTVNGQTMSGMVAKTPGAAAKKAAEPPSAPSVPAAATKAATASKPSATK
jgi:competence protein ComEA